MRTISCIVAATSLVSAAPPIAKHVTVVVNPGEEAVVDLRGYDTDGDPLSATITSLPSSGALHQLSKVYSTHGYDPKKGKAAAVNAPVTGSRNRVHYVRPEYDVEPSSGKWASFAYTINDGTSTSKAATVTLVGPSRRVVASPFDASHEQWSIVRNGAGSGPATHDASSFGKGLNRFVVATDELIARDASSGLETNASRWMFEAPPAWAGDQNAAYKGTLEFTIGALAGDLSAPSKAHNFIELECATCDVNAGVLLAFPVSAAKKFDGSTTTFSIPLDETAGWRKDPKNSLFAWPQPSQCDMIEVLSGLSGLRILGDLTDWYESIALDAVSLKAPASGRSEVPTCAQGTPDASVCTC